MIKKSYLFTFNELWNAFNDSNDKLVTLGLAYYLDILDSYTDNSHIAQLSNVFDYTDNTFSFKDYIEELLRGVFYRNQNQYFLSISKAFEPWNEDNVTAEDDDVQKGFIAEFYNLFQYLNQIAPKYQQLLSLYDSNKAKLMNQLSSKTVGSADVTATNRFNDTPQESGTFEDDSHTTNFQENVSGTDTESTTTYDDANIMKRLDEINSLYKNVMQNWIGEFDKFFYEVY